MPCRGRHDIHRATFYIVVFVFESEPDVVPFIATFKLSKAMHEDEVFALVLILVQDECVDHLEKNNEMHEQYGEHRDIVIEREPLK
jgi:hypothetical protein